MRSRLLKACVALAALALGASAAAAAKANFAGTWVLDLSRSEGQFPPGLEQTYTITQEGDKLDLSLKQKTPQGERTLTDTIVLDGKQVAFNPPPPPPNQPQPRNGKRTARWLADGGVEIIDTWDIDTQDGPDTFEMKRKWTLAPDGKTFTIEQNFKGTYGLSQTKRVFVKQG
ncbi:MAG TPA: hypothetical protein VK421_13155 [Pyrinomonadaceae bacterium]|nr:hypothetical protein [Pyrinomonadaceae bacterium]